MVGDNNERDQNNDEKQGRQPTRIGERKWQVLGVLLAFLTIVVSVVVWRWPNIVGEPDFRISVNPMVGTAIQDEQTTTTVTVEAFHGYNFPVQLESPDLPSYFNVIFSEPDPKKPRYEATFTVEVAENVPPDDYQIEITGRGSDGTEQQCTFSLKVDASDTFTLTINQNGEGVLDPAEGQYQCDSWTEERISAQPAEGWTFDGWTGDVNDEALMDTTVTMSGDKTVTAHFSQIMYTLNIECDGNGLLAPSAGHHLYPCWEEVPISAQAAEGWAFLGWSGDVSDETSTYTMVTMSGDKTITASFSQIMYKLRVNVLGTGTVTPGEGTHSYAHGSVVKLTAEPGSGWGFDRWSSNVDNRDQANTEVTMDSDKNVTVTFVEMLPDLVITAVTPNPILHYVGGSIPLEVTVKNQGNVEVGPYFIDVYKSRTTTPAPGDRGVIQTECNALPSKASRKTTIQIQYNYSGSYNLWVQVDPTQDHEELDETNNLYGPISVTITFV